MQTGGGDRDRRRQRLEQVVLGQRYEDFKARSKSAADRIAKATVDFLNSCHAEPHAKEDAA